MGKEEKAKMMKKTEKTKMAAAQITTLLTDYMEYSTVAGLHYAFDRKQPKLGNILWMISVSILTFFGIYVSVQNYSEWKTNPVMTTVTTAGMPISKVPFPSVVICSQGSNTENFVSAIFKYFQDYQKSNNGLEFHISPIKFTRFFTKSLLKVIYNLKVYLYDMTIKKFICMTCHET
jgi:hypothetical protein